MKNGSPPCAEVNGAPGKPAVTLVAQCAWGITEVSPSGQDGVPRSDHLPTSWVCGMYAYTFWYMIQYHYMIWRLIWYMVWLWYMRYMIWDIWYEYMIIWDYTYTYYTRKHLSNTDILIRYATSTVQCGEGSSLIAKLHHITLGSEMFQHNFALIQLQKVFNKDWLIHINISMCSPLKRQLDRFFKDYRVRMFCCNCSGESRVSCNCSLRALEIDWNLQLFAFAPLARCGGQRTPTEQKIGRTAVRNN